MSNYVTDSHFRKFSPIDREYPIYELIEKDRVLLDISANDDGVIEVAIHEASVNRIFEFEQLNRILMEGRKLVENDME